MTTIGRKAVVVASAEQIAPYLPVNYTPMAELEIDGRVHTLIMGHDSAGWTLDDYVLPRLASGLYFGWEVSFDNPSWERP